jgi:hypothetical protein
METNWGGLGVEERTILRLVLEFECEVVVRIQVAQGRSVLYEYGNCRSDAIKDRIASN